MIQSIEIRVVGSVQHPMWCQRCWLSLCVWCGVALCTSVANGKRFLLDCSELWSRVRCLCGPIAASPMSDPEPAPGSPAATSDAAASWAQPAAAANGGEVFNNTMYDEVKMISSGLAQYSLEEQNAFVVHLWEPGGLP